LALALKQLHDDRAGLRAMGEKGKVVVHQRFHADRMAEDTVAVYQQYARKESLLST
jgi:hypothetical protein